MVEPAYRVNVSRDGLVTYAEPQTIEFQVLVTEGAGLTTTYARRLYVPTDPNSIVTIRPDALPEGVVGVPYRQVLTASGPPGPYTFENRVVAE